jgi:hypothetical protein
VTGIKYEMGRDEQAHRQDEPRGVEDLEGSFGGHVVKVCLLI